MRKPLFYAISFLLLALIPACRNNGQEKPFEWQTIVIGSEHYTEYRIENNEDSSSIYFYHEGSIFEPLTGKIKIDTLKAYFTKAEKDTIAFLVKDLIVNPPPINGFCTEFVGKLNLFIYHSPQFVQTAKYSSVCDWTKLSDKTRHLNAILERSRKKFHKK